MKHWKLHHSCVYGDGADGSSYSQQALVRLLLIRLVGDVGQIHPPQSGAVVQDDVAHVEAQDVCLQPVLQVLQKPEQKTQSERGQGNREDKLTPRGIRGSSAGITSPLTDVFDFGQLGEEPLLLLSSQALGELLRQHEVVHGDRQAANVRRFRRHQLKLRLR